LSQSNRSESKSKSPIIWPLALVATGVILLLHNFILLGDLNILNLSPLILVLVGAWILLRGDIRPSGDAKSFGITRGSVESATLDIRSGEIDVAIAMLPTSNQERLIAYRSFPVQSRPDLKVDGVHTQLTMRRQHTPWFSYTDWDMLIAQHMPWQLLITSHLGQVNLDLAEGIVSNVRVATGIGNIHLVTPYEALDDIYLSSTLGTTHLTTPFGYASRITIEQGRFMTIHVDDTRYQMLENGDYASLEAEENAPIVYILVSGTFGDVYLS
jgi:hypothetical protein